MSCISGPNNNTNGLVFEYDMANTQKSWRGMPTTNLYYAVNNYLNGNGNNWINSGSATFNDNDTTLSPPKSDKLTNIPANLRISSATCTVVGSQECGMGITTISPSTTYSLSIWLYIRGGTNVFAGPPYMRTSVNNNNLCYFSYNGITDSTKWPTNQWINIIASGTTQSNETGIYLSSYIGNSVGDAIFYYGYQVEVGPIASPLVAGTRSNTQALLDLTGNSTLTASSLTYANDGTFSFNGGTDSIYVPSIPQGSGSNFSVIAWVNSSAVSGAQNIVSMNGPYFMRITNSTVRFNVHTTGGWLFQQGTTILNNNTWYQLSMVYNYDASLWIGYINGNQEFSVSKSGVLSNTNFYSYIGYTPQVGEQAPFNGKIQLVQFYNRALSASEIASNYNSQKEKFFGYQAITYISSSNVTLTNNGTTAVTMFKTASNNSWDSHVYSADAFTAPCTIEFTKNAGTTDNGVSYAMIGWNADPTTDQSYSSLDYAAYPYRTDTYSVYHNSSQVSFSGSWDPNQKFYIVYDTDGYIRHYNGSTLLYSVNKGTNQTVYVDSSFYSVNATYGGFTDVRVCRKSWNGLNYVG